MFSSLELLAPLFQLRWTLSLADSSRSGTVKNAPAFIPKPIVFEKLFLDKSEKIYLQLQQRSFSYKSFWVIFICILVGWGRMWPLWKNIISVSLCSFLRRPPLYNIQTTSTQEICFRRVKEKHFWFMMAPETSQRNFHDRVILEG